MFLIEPELFVQHSVGIEGEHGDTRWTPHWGTLPVDEEEIYFVKLVVPILDCDWL